MKKKYLVSIPEPCSEGWSNMTPEGQGRHCKSCDKVVVDFTSMSDSEIINLLKYKKSKNERVCGHFRSTQVNKVIHEAVPLRNRPGGFLIVATLLSGLAFLPAYGQEKLGKVKVETIHTKGDVAMSEVVDNTVQQILIIDPSGKPIPGAKLILNEIDYKGQEYVSSKDGMIIISRIGKGKSVSGALSHKDYEFKSFEFVFGHSKQFTLRMDYPILIDGMIEGDIELIEDVKE